MISDEDVEAIAVGWIKEFSVDPYFERQREMDAWFELDDLIYNHPQDALLVFEKVAENDLINWTCEGFAVGPLRTFLMLHEERYAGDLMIIRQRNQAFNEMYAMATGGL